MTDAHIHIEARPYTKAWIDRFVHQAVVMKLNEIYLLEHAYRFHEFAPMFDHVRTYSDDQKDWHARRVGQLKLKQYTDLITAMREYDFPVRIKWGLEVCYFPEHETAIKTLAASFPFDFITGSVHWIDGFGFDHQAAWWNNINVNAAYTRYYELMIDLVNSGLFSNLAHPDSIKCFGNTTNLDLTETYKQLADALNRQNMTAEQNDGLHLNYGHREMGMNASMLHIFKENNVRIVFASDAHKPEDVGKNIGRMMADF